eukprot:6209320-Pleurochrysis_carterae.AAC.3
MALHASFHCALHLAMPFDRHRAYSRLVYYLTEARYSKVASLGSVFPISCLRAGAMATIWYM